MAVGAAVTWLAAWYYFKRAGDELQREAASLHKAVNFVIAYLQNQHGRITIEYDDQNRIKNLIVAVEATTAKKTMTTHNATIDGPRSGG
jgi:low affinity Fe/Cu permease